MDCKCDECRGYCEHKPGWFAPGEAEEAAKLMGMSVEEFFQEYLAVDYWMGDDEFPTTFVLSPRTTKMETGGTEFPLTPHGTCVFLKDGLCQIHEAKPTECAAADHTTTAEEGQKTKKEIVKKWMGRQKDIEELLGRKPAIKDPDVFDVLSFLKDMLP